MKTLTIEIPDDLTHEHRELVGLGLFDDSADLALHAPRVRVHRHCPALAETLQRDDIRCALGLQRVAG